MAGEAYEPYFALALSLRQRLGSASLADKKVRIVVERHAVNLPEIQVIGLQAAQRLVEHGERQILVASVRAYLGHQENAVTHAFESFAHPVFTLAAMILPAVVKEGDPGGDRILHQTYGRSLVFGVAQMMAAEPKCGNAHIVVPAEGASRNSRCLWHAAFRLPAIGWQVRNFGHILARCNWFVPPLIQRQSVDYRTRVTVNFVHPELLK